MLVMSDNAVLFLEESTTEIVTLLHFHKTKVRLPAATVSVREARVLADLADLVRADLYKLGLALAAEGSDLAGDVLPLDLELIFFAPLPFAY